MNASNRSRIIAEGTFLWAMLQDMPVKDIEGSSYKKDWDDFERDWPELVPICKRFQNEMFETALRI